MLHTWWGSDKLSLICFPQLEGIRAREDGVTWTCLVRDNLGVSSPLHRDAESCWASSESRTGDAEGVHDGVRCQLVNGVVNVTASTAQIWLQPQNRLTGPSRIERASEQGFCGGSQEDGSSDHQTSVRR